MIRGSVFVIVSTAVWTLFAVIWCLAVIDGIRTGDDELVGGAAILAVPSALLAGAGVVVALRSRRDAAPAQVPPASRPLPSRTSAARVPMERLAEAEVALWDLVDQLVESADGSSVAQRVVDDVERVAVEAPEAFRRVAADVTAVEATARHAPAARRAGLEDVLRGLLVHLDRGLEGYRQLIAAAEHVVLAGTWDPVPADLIEATDHMVGLVSALRDLADGTEFR